VAAHGERADREDGRTRPVEISCPQLVVAVEESDGAGRYSSITCHKGGEVNQGPAAAELSDEETVVVVLAVMVKLSVLKEVLSL
jgi:hypothetical protein